MPPTWPVESRLEVGALSGPGFGRSQRKAIELRNPRGTSLSDVYHSDPAPGPGLGLGLVELAFDVFEGDFEEAAVDRVEEGVTGNWPPGQRQTEDFFAECFAAPVRQKPFLCV